MNPHTFAFAVSLVLIAYGTITMRWSAQQWPDRLPVFRFALASFLLGCVLLGASFAAYCLFNGVGA